MATSRRTDFSIPTPFYAALVVLVLVLATCRKINSVDEDTEKKQPVTITMPQTKDPAPKIIDELISNFDTHAVVIRSGDWEYVSMGGAVFCRRGDKLLGVYNKKGAVWQASTNN